MKPQTLISMVDYVLLQNDNWKREIDVMTHFNNCVNYAQSLQQPPTIADFIPSVYENGKWRMLAKPKEKDFYTPMPDVNGKKAWNTNKTLFKEAVDQYQTALNNVKFSGWEVRYNSVDCIVIGIEGFEVTLRLLENKTQYLSITDFTKKDPTEDELLNFEQLIKHNIPLTERGMEYFNINI